MKGLGEGGFYHYPSWVETLHIMVNGMISYSDSPGMTLNSTGTVVWPVSFNYFFLRYVYHLLRILDHFVLLCMVNSLLNHTFNILWILSFTRRVYT